MNDNRIIIRLESYNMKTKKRKFMSQRSLDRKLLRKINRIIDDMYLNEDKHLY